MKKTANCKINTAIVVLLGLGVVLYVVNRIMFPAFSYHINKTDKFKVQVLRQQIGSKNYLAITPLYDYTYNEIKMEIYGKFEQDSRGIDVYKDYMVQLYPVGDIIESENELRELLFFENDTEFSNGTLVSFNNAVFFISRGQRRPFLGPEVFLRLGFDWDEVETENGQGLVTMEQGEKINFISPHPDGTILETKQENLFLVWNKERLPIENRQLLENVWPNNHVVRTASEKANLAGVCSQIKYSPKKMSCFLDSVEMTGDRIGHTYVFDLSRDLVESSSDASIRFDLLGRIDVLVAKESLKRVKDILYLKYGEFVF
ncbi:MAG: hypothetical protein U9O20_02870 [Patescibacteria group bacterium]|nr:hypothetical protein [Patescibacteria group bacterium]